MVRFQNGRSAARCSRSAGAAARLGRRNRVFSGGETPGTRSLSWCWGCRGREGHGRSDLNLESIEVISFDTLDDGGGATVLAWRRRPCQARAGWGWRPLKAQPRREADARWQALAADPKGSILPCVAGQGYLLAGHQSTRRHLAAQRGGGAALGLRRSTGQTGVRQRPDLLDRQDDDGGWLTTSRGRLLSIAQGSSSRGKAKLEHFDWCCGCRGSNRAGRRRRLLHVKPSHLPA